MFMLSNKSLYHTNKIKLSKVNGMFFFVFFLFYVKFSKRLYRYFFSFSTRTVSLLFWINNLIFRNRFINWLYLHNKKKVLLCNENMKFSNKEKNWKRQIKQRSLRLQSNNCYEKSIFTWLFVDFFFFLKMYFLIVLFG